MSVVIVYLHQTPYTNAMSLKQFPMLNAKRRQTIEILTPLRNCNAIAHLCTAMFMMRLGNASGKWSVMVYVWK